MDLTHIHAFTAAMARKDLETMLSHMTDDIILKTPLVAEPFKGKAAIRPVVEALLGVVDKFDFREIMQGPEHVSAFFGITVGSNELDGVDHWRLNDAGLDTGDDCAVASAAGSDGGVRKLTGADG